MAGDDDDDDHAPKYSLSGFFTSDKDAQIEKAKAESLLKRIVKITADTHGKYMQNGVAVNVEQFSLWQKRSVLHNYGCSVAVSLYLTFQLRCAGMFIVMLVLDTDLVPSLRRI